MQKPKYITLQAKKQMCGYVFVLPFLIGFLLFFLAPLLFYIVMAFSKMSLGSRGMEFTFNGFENIQYILTNNATYLVSVFDSLKSIVIQLFTTVLYSLFIAILLNQKFKGRFFVRAMFFLPVVVASGVAAVNSEKDVLLSNAQSILSGIDTNTSVKMSKNITQSIISLFGTENYTSGFVSLVTNIVSSIYDITQASGVQILIFLAGIQTISPSLYEASHIDGATAWENFWKITVPLISPYILVNAIYTIIDSLASINNKTVTLFYETAAKELNYTRSAAMGVMYFAIVLSVLAAAMFIMSRFVYYEDRVDKKRKRGYDL